FASVHHSHLPSFPTRRSSDLDPLDPHRAGAEYSSRGAESDGLQFPLGNPELNLMASPKTKTILSLVLLGVLLILGVGLYNLRARSEEHTSELQSLRHLVCRLL